MIRCFLVINNFGKPRLMKFYERLTNEERQVRKDLLGADSLEIRLPTSMFPKRSISSRRAPWTQRTDLAAFVVRSSFAILSRAQKAIEYSYKLVSKRMDDLCNFVEDDKLFGGDTQLIYRHFATLYFIVICDKAESELGILDLIQVRRQPLPRPPGPVAQPSPRLLTDTDPNTFRGPGVRGDSRQELRERVRARHHFQPAEGRAHFGRDDHGGPCSRDE